MPLPLLILIVILIAAPARADLTLSGNATLSGAVRLEAITLPALDPAPARQTNTVDYWITFEDDGLATAAKLTNVTTSAVGIFNYVLSGSTLLLLTNEANQTLHSYVKIGATVYDDAAGTRGLRAYLNSNSTDLIQVTMPAGHNQMAIAGFFKTTMPFANYNNYDFFQCDRGDGAEFISPSLKQLALRAHTKLYLETSGDPVSIARNVWYWLCITWDRNNVGRVYVYSTATWQLIGSSQLGIGDYNTDRFYLGIVNSHDALTDDYYWFDNWVIVLDSASPIPP